MIHSNRFLSIPVRVVVTFVLALVNVFPVNADECSGVIDVDVWPSAGEAAICCLAQILDTLDSQPGLENRACVLEATGNAECLIPAAMECFQRAGFAVSLADRNSGIVAPTVVLVMLGNGREGRINVSLPGSELQTAAGFRSVPWMSGRGRVKQSGPFVVTTGDSDWCADAGMADKAARLDAFRTLTGRSGPTSSAELDCLRKPHQRFQQSGMRDFNRVTRVAYEFVLHEKDYLKLKAPPEPPEQVDNEGPGRVCTTVILSTMASAFAFLVRYALIRRV